MFEKFLFKWLGAELQLELLTPVQLVAVIDKLCGLPGAREEAGRGTMKFLQLMFPPGAIFSEDSHNLVCLAPYSTTL